MTETLLSWTKWQTFEYFQHLFCVFDGPQIYTCFYKFEYHFATTCTGYAGMKKCMFLTSGYETAAHCKLKEIKRSVVICGLYWWRIPVPHCKSVMCCMDVLPAHIFLHYYQPYHTQCIAAIAWLVRSHVLARIDLNTSVICLYWQPYWFQVVWDLILVTFHKFAFWASHV